MNSWCIAAGEALGQWVVVLSTSRVRTVPTVKVVPFVLLSVLLSVLPFVLRRGQKAGGSRKNVELFNNGKEKYENESENAAQKTWGCSGMIHSQFFNLAQKTHRSEKTGKAAVQK